MTARTLFLACALTVAPIAALHAGEPDPTIADPAGETAPVDSAVPAASEAEAPAPPPAAAAAAPVDAPTDVSAPAPEAAASNATAPDAVASDTPPPAEPVAAPIVADPAITQSDPETERKLANVRVVTVRNLDWRELAPGMAIYEQGGKLIGKVVSVSGSDVIVDGAQAQIRVPLIALYTYNVGGVDYIASRMTRADLQKGG